MMLREIRAGSNYRPVHITGVIGSDGDAYRPVGDELERFADEMWQIHRDFGLRVLGGCCGTDDRHMRALSRPPDGAS